MLSAYAIGAEPLGSGEGSTPAVAPSGPTITIELVGSDGSPLANLTGLKWAFFDEASPELLTSPVASGVSEVTDGSGSISIDVTGTSHSSGGIGWLVLSTSDGNPANPYRQLCGPVAVD